MSGPIVRQYGVPNWDEIFGKQDDKEPAQERQPDAPDEPTDQGKSADSSDCTER